MTNNPLPTEIADLRAALLEGVEVTAADVPMVVVPDNCKLVDLERWLVTPARVRARFVTPRLDDFLTYVQRHADTEDSPHCYVTVTTNPQGRPTGMVADAVLDHGSAFSPRWREHHAIWQPEVHPALQGITSFAASPVTQDALLDYLDNWGDFLRFVRPDGTAVPFPQARAAFADMTAETVRQLRGSVGEFKREKSAFETTSMASNVPTLMVLTVAPWRDLEVRDLEVRISAAESGAVAVRLTLLRWAFHCERMVDEAMTRLRNELADNSVTVLYGSMEP